MRVVPTAVLTAALIAVAVPVAAHATTTSRTASVKIAGYAFSPKTLTIPVGTTVTWTDKDADAHNVTSSKGPKKFHSSTLTKGKTYRFTFTKPGTYRYGCTFHSDMHGTVTVTPKH
jgi:plastocyanin